MESTGELKMTASHTLPLCREMGGVTASSDCSVIGAICISSYGPENHAAWKPMPGLRPPFGNGTREPPTRGWFRGASNSNRWYAYVYEWTSGTIATEPDASFTVSEAIGSWRYGTMSLRLNGEGSMYSVHLKTVTHNHEGSLQTKIRRSDLTNIHSRWGCGAGHVMWNVQAWNEAKEATGHWCWTDGRGYNNVWFERGAGQGKVHVAALIHTNRGKSEDRRWYTGGPTDLVSRGHKGWIGVYTSLAARDVDNSHNINIWTDETGVVKQLDLVQRFNHRKDTSTSYPHLARFGSVSEDSDRFLLGWAEFEPSGPIEANMQSPGTWYSRLRAYHVAEMDAEGNINKHYNLGAEYTSWYDANEWTTIPATGCVVWAQAWSESAGPLWRYGCDLYCDDSKDPYWSSKMRLTLVCPDEWSPSPSSETGGSSPGAACAAESRLQEQRQRDEIGLGAWPAAEPRRCGS
jgi:hypothetical protein